MSFTRNDVIQHHNQQLLQAFGQNDTATCFAVGDIANEEWENAIRNGWDKPVRERGGDFVTKDFICASAAYYYGKSKRSIRYYADVSAFFPQEIRDRFDVLSFSHFANARQHEDWLDYLKYAQSGGQDGGIVSVDGCNAEWTVRHKQQVETILEEIPIPEPRPLNPFSFAGVCQHASNLLARFQDDGELPEGPRAKVRQAIKLIAEAIAEISETV